MADLALGAVTHGSEVGHHADVPEDDGDGCVSGDREDVPQERGAELRPDVHGVGIGEHPEGDPGPSDVDEGEHAGADDGEDGHRLSEAVDGVTPALFEEEEDGGDEVPAWPMPIHQTKLMMANPQATGR